MKFIFPRVDCESPEQYYTCASNSFKGCCSVDPCPLSGCPKGGDSTASQDKSSKSKPSSTQSEDDSGDDNTVTGILAITVTGIPTPVIVSPTYTPISIGVVVPQPTILQPPSSQSQATSQQAAGQSTQSQATSQQAAGQSTQSQATSQQAAGQSPSSARSSQAPSTIVVVSTAVQTPTSNGIALAPTTLLITTTAYSSPGAAVQTSSPAPSVAAGSAPSSNTPVIGGVVGGVGGVLIAAALLWFCFRRRSKRKKEMREEKAAHGHEDDPREQGIDAHRAGDVIAGYRGPDRGVDRHLKVQARESMAGSESTVTATEYGHTGEKKLPTPPVTPIRQAYTEEAVPYLDSTPVQPNLEMTGSSPDPIGFTPELSGIAAVHQPAELSPDPERLRINNRSSAYGDVGNAVPRTSNGDIMRSNLNLSNGGPNRRAPNGAARHVLSWMEYSPNGTPRTDATESSPTSGVWSSAESSNFVRNSGVSQDSSTPGWQRERRIKDGGGGLEAITDEPRI